MLFKTKKIGSNRRMKYILIGDIMWKMNINPKNETVKIEILKYGYKEGYIQDLAVMSIKVLDDLVKRGIVIIHPVEYYEEIGA